MLIKDAINDTYEKFYDIELGKILIEDIEFNQKLSGYRFTSVFKKYIEEKYGKKIYSEKYSNINFIHIDEKNFIPQYKIYIHDENMHNYFENSFTFKVGSIIFFIYNSGLEKDLVRVLPFNEFIKKINKQFENEINSKEKIIAFHCKHRTDCLDLILHIMSHPYINANDLCSTQFLTLSNLSVDRTYTAEELRNMGIILSNISVEQGNISIPILEDISGNQFIFYKNNFEKYRKELYEKYGIKN